MHIIKYALFITALSLPVTNTHALEWVDYDGTIPDNAVMVNEGVEDRPICRKNERIGLIKNDLCHSVKAGGNFDKKDIDDGYQILVDTYNWQEVAESALGHMPESGSWTYNEEERKWQQIDLQAMHEEILGEEVFTQTMLDDAVDDAVAAATSGLIPPGDCGNSEEEAFKAGVNSVYFYIVGEIWGGPRGGYSSDGGDDSGNWSSWFNGEGRLKNAMDDYLNGRCSDVDESLYPEFNGCCGDTGGTFAMPMTCESFKCRPDNSYKYADTASSVAWGVFPESAAIYCSNVDDDYFFRE